MKFLDDVIVTNDNYANEGIHKGMRGTIAEAAMMQDGFFVEFEDPRYYDKEFMSHKENIYKLKHSIYTLIKAKDLQVVFAREFSDKQLQDCLPPEHKDWWCKVENGYILNAKGERKNKVAYDYDS